MSSARERCIAAVLAGVLGALSPLACFAQSIDEDEAPASGESRGNGAARVLDELEKQRKASKKPQLSVQAGVSHDHFQKAQGKTRQGLSLAAKLTSGPSKAQLRHDSGRTRLSAQAAVPGTQRIPLIQPVVQGQHDFQSPGSHKSDGPRFTKTYGAGLSALNKYTLSYERGNYEDPAQLPGLAPMPYSGWRLDSSGKLLVFWASWLTHETSKRTGQIQLPGGERAGVKVVSRDIDIDVNRLLGTNVLPEGSKITLGHEKFSLKQEAPEEMPAGSQKQEGAPESDGKSSTDSFRFGVKLGF